MNRRDFLSLTVKTAAGAAIAGIPISLANADTDSPEGQLRLRLRTNIGTLYYDIPYWVQARKHSVHLMAHRNLEIDVDKDFGQSFVLKELSARVPIWGYYVRAVIPIDEAYCFAGGTVTIDFHKDGFLSIASEVIPRDTI